MANLVKSIHLIYKTLFSKFSSCSLLFYTKSRIIDNELYEMDNRFNNYYKVKFYLLTIFMLKILFIYIIEDIITFKNWFSHKHRTHNFDVIHFISVSFITLTTTGSQNYQSQNHIYHSKFHNPFILALLQKIYFQL